MLMLMLLVELLQATGGGWGGSAWGINGIERGQNAKKRDQRDLRIPQLAMGRCMILFYLLYNILDNVSPG